MDISVVIPTTANARRGPYLLGALNSLYEQSEHRVRPIVVVNGGSSAPDVLTALRSDARLRLLYREQADEMAAVIAGRRIVDTEYYGVLDDDDLYLPNACAVRIAALRADPPADAVVTNGFRRTLAGDSPFVDDFEKIDADPLGMAMHQSWMISAGAMFRSDAIGEEFFRDAPSMAEYTYLGLRIALTRKLRFAAAPTFIKQDLLPDAITRSRAYVMAQPSAVQTLMTLALPPHIQRELKRKLSSSHHSVSSLELSTGNLNRAWRAHLQSLRLRSGLRYMSYSFHLIRATIANPNVLPMLIGASLGDLLNP